MNGIISQAIGERCGQEIEKNFGDSLGKKDAALVEATLFGPALGGSRKFLALRIEDIGWNRF